MTDQHPVFQKYQRQHGRGWKRKLAATLRVSETNVHAWTTTGKMSAIVTTALDLLDENEDLQRDHADAMSENVLVVLQSETEQLYTVVRRNSQTGIFVCVGKDIPELALARAFAACASGGLRDAINRVGDDLHNLLSEDDDVMAHFRELETFDRPSRGEEMARMARDFNEMFTDETFNNDLNEQSDGNVVRLRTQEKANE